MRIRCIAVAGTALLVATLAGADERSDLRAIGEGRALYVTHCASCHGTDATGLTARSLTLIAQRDRTFDKLHVANHIRGRSDGFVNHSMPAWQPALTDAWPGGTGAAMLATRKLVRYLEFVQVGAPPPTVASTVPR